LKNISLALLQKGLHQKEGVTTDVFAYGSNLVALRMLLSMTVNADLEMHPLDVKMAFLNGNLDEEVYLPPPKGAKVCQIRCGAYQKHCTVCNRQRRLGTKGLNHLCQQLGFRWLHLIHVYTVHRLVGSASTC
jgi:hypothetical protein